MASIESFFKKHPVLDFLGNIASMIVMGVLIIIAVYLSLIFYTHHGNTVKVPNVIKKDYKEAKRLLEEAGLRVVVTDTCYETKYPANLILDQHIPAGTTVKFNRQIFLTINSDHARMIALPEIIDGSARQAEMKLKAMGYKLGEPKRVPGDLDLVMGVLVNGKDVSTGHRVSVETPIVLVVGNGETNETYNGNDSMDWVLERQIEDELRLKAEADRDIRARMNAARNAGPSTLTETPVEVQLAPVDPSGPIHVSSKDLE